MGGVVGRILEELEEENLNLNMLYEKNLFSIKGKIVLFKINTICYFILLNTVWPTVSVSNLGWVQDFSILCSNSLFEICRIILVQYSSSEFSLPLQSLCHRKCFCKIVNIFYNIQKWTLSIKHISCTILTKYFVTWVTFYYVYPCEQWHNCYINTFVIKWFRWRKQYSWMSISAFFLLITSFQEVGMKQLLQVWYKTCCQQPLLLNHLYMSPQSHGGKCIPERLPIR